MSGENNPGQINTTPPPQAAVDEVALKRQAARSEGQKNMLFGALWAIGGIVVTAVTYSMAASSPSGGHYFIAWGAVIFGGFQFIKGLIQLLSNL